MAEALATIAAFFTVGLRLCTAGNERWQAIDVVAFSGLCGWLRLLPEAANCRPKKSLTVR